ncbi:hypothetical protein [Bradyrhizobium sp. WSM2793]|uniref:hypothetical protein n=1 Tax=Bradyrhizobium sp. WSM2793 TaxID=1038866 RepID=UPI000374AE1F|nr:hypothetical protein [Bradyrhizobium sp. WSM2793]
MSSSYPSISPDTRLIGTAAAPALHRCLPERDGRGGTAAEVGAVAKRFDTTPFDVEPLNADFPLPKAFYRWCCDAAKETHSRPINRVN